jgi:hypothetical protein
VLPSLAALALAALVAWISYPRPFASRLAAAGFVLRWGTLFLVLALILDAAAGPRRTRAPLVALDASQSWDRARDSTRWSAALERARAAADGDTLWLVGDSVRPAGDAPEPSDDRSQITPLVERAAAAGRAVMLFTDGELDDPERWSRVLSGSRIDVGPASTRLDIAVRGLEAPRAIVDGDTAEVVVRLLASAAGSPAGAVRVRVDDTDLAIIPFTALPPFGERELREVILPPTGGRDQRVLRAIVSATGDAEPRNDTLAVVIEVAPTPRGVFVSTSPDQDARFALDVLRGTLQLPVRAFYRVAPGVWRQEPGLTAISESGVRDALVAAPFAVLHGDTALFGEPRRVTAGGLALLAPAARGGEGEWYATAPARSPLSPAFVGVPWDSVPPISMGAAARGAWTALMARPASGGEPRALIAGDDTPRRTVVVAGSGYWRWQFRGGVSADVHRAMWGGLFDWIAAGGDDRRAAVPATHLLRAGEPIRWRRGAGRDSLVPFVVRSIDGTRSDSVTLRFAGESTVAVSTALPAGEYEAALRGGLVRLVVNRSAEWIPRPAATLPRVRDAALALGEAPRLRDRWWVYVLLTLLLSAEWLLRRRAGLR